MNDKAPPMNLDPEGKKRLESMKKTLAAGLPLAGLLAAAATVGTAAQGCSSGAVMGKMPAPPPEEQRALDRDTPSPRLLPDGTTVTAGLILMPEAPPIPAPPENPAPPESPPDAP